MKFLSFPGVIYLDIFRGWSSGQALAPLIWIFNLVCRAHIPGIELAIVLFIQLLANSPHSHSGW